MTSTGTISVRTRKRLWLRSGGVCAFPGCETHLLEPTPLGDDDTVVGIECHVVAREDDPTVARSVSLLSQEERVRFQHLIEDRHGFANLVIMCPSHSRIIDDPKQAYSVERILEIKRAHEERFQAGRTAEQARDEQETLWYAGVIDEFEARARLNEWDPWVGRLVADGHPMMDQEDFDALTETRAWLFNRPWPGSNQDLEDAFENFRRVAQDLQAVLGQHPHENLRRQGAVAITRFYNDARFFGEGDGPPDHKALDEMYEFYSLLVEDLAYELTRAANLICEVVRRTLDPSYRETEGLLTLTAGPFIEDMSIRTSRPRYARDAGSHPYEGLDAFLEARSGRDIVRGSGGRPPGVRLPGDPLFGR